MSNRWAIFRNRNFVQYWLGYLLSALGDGVFDIALAWIVVEITGSGLVMGSIMLTMGLPRIVLMLVGGVVTDRMSPRLIMVISDLARTVVMGALFVLSLRGTPPIWSLYAMALVFGVMDAFYWPAAGAFKQHLVAEEHFTQMNSMVVGSLQASSIVGPLAGALLVHWGGYSLNILVDGLSFVVSALTLAGLTVQVQPVAAKKSFGADMLMGLRYVRYTPIILAMALTGLLGNIGANGVGVATPFLAKVLGVGVDGLGHMYSGFGFGGVAGAILFTFWVIRHPSPRMSIAAFSLQGIAIALVGLATNQWQVAALLALVGVASTSIQVIAPSVYQSIIPSELMGRVSSVTALVAMGSTPLAQAAAGWLLDRTSPQAIFIGGGVLEAVAAGVILCLPVVRLWRKPEATEPSLAISA